MKRKFIAFLSALFCLALCISTASADEVGSLCLKGIHDSVRLYHVATADFVLTEPFQGVTGIDTEHLSTSPEAAKILSEFAQLNEISGRTQTADSAGAVRFAPLEEGLYLACSLASEPEFLPFIVTIPMEINGKTVYHILAEPKIQDPSGPTAPPPPVEPEPEPEIPQTGISVWPKYILLAAGTVLLVAGLIDLFRGRREKRT